ncbi:Auxin-induced protein 15A [Glycine soja]|uniref:Uncharacterized protein n=2 Tax=Glycine subgen. Soja TaxID=1462606 RepID=A0A0R0FNK0_SOYBN|nr:Auxin-induced protein 15A [Glycine soja]
MEDAGASKLHGIKKIVRLKEMFQKWQNLRRFIIPTSYLSHTLFKVLLEKVAEEFGFDQSGGLIIPCEIETFKCLLNCIARVIILLINEFALYHVGNTGTVEEQLITLI